MLWQVNCFCERWYYKKITNMRDASTRKLYLAAKIFHLDSFVVFSSIFIPCGDWKFDFMFFIQLIWWIRTGQIFKKFDQVKMFPMLQFTLLNLFDSTNLIKLTWPCISGDLSIVDWFKKLCYFRFLFKNSFGKPFCSNLYFSQSFCLFCIVPCYCFFFLIFFFKFPVITQFMLLTLVFTRCHVLSTTFFYHWIMCYPIITIRKLNHSSFQNAEVCQIHCQHDI